LIFSSDFLKLEIKRSFVKWMKRFMKLTWFTMRFGNSS